MITQEFGLMKYIHVFHPFGVAVRSKSVPDGFVTWYFLKEWNNHVYFRLKKMPCGFKEQVRARQSREKCGLMSGLHHMALLAALVAFPGATSHADTPGTLDTVRDFFANIDSLQADFHQEVIDSNGQQQQVSDGKVWILRPGRFRWDYLTPYRQQIVADGERLWSYDEDLAQVTVQAMDTVLGATPAMLLSGGEPIDKVFQLEARPAAGNTLHARLIPRADDNNITEIHVYFNKDILARIEAIDSFGNHTAFDFTNLVRNAGLDATRFRFVPPEGTDIIGDTR
jgi:chaperone LolA